MNFLRGSIVGGGLLLLGAAPASSQVILDWPIRTHGEAEALSRGASAAFTNPAGLARVGRLEALVVDLSSPEEIGIGGIAVAAAAALPGRFSVGASYAHLSLGRIPVTTISPTTFEPTQPELEIAEDRFTLAVARPIVAGAELGAMIGYQRAGYDLGTLETVRVGAGAAIRPALRLDPEIAGSIDYGDGDFHWLAGAGLALPVRDLSDVRMRLSYGIEGGDATRLSHRFTLGAVWRERIRVSGGFERQDAEGAIAWEPALAGAVTLGRYELGVVRETMPNGFGAAYFYRFTYRM